MKKLLQYFLLIIVLVSCKEKEQKQTAITTPAKDTLLQTPMGVTISEDTAKLSKILDFKTFKPDSVAFKYTGADINMLPADSAAMGKHYSLEAILIYDEHTYAAILEKYMDAGFPKAKLDRSEFNFDWMDDAIKRELQLSNADYFGNPDIFLGTNRKAKLWFLDKKILVKLTNP